MVARGRRKTDKSLGAERAETDAQVTLRRTKREDTADESVDDKRSHTDRKQRKARGAADAERSTERAQPDEGRESERRSADARLEAERASADKDLASERANVDSTRTLERAASRASQAILFGKERTATDRDLSSEREFADESDRKVREDHSTEAGRHALTRQALMLRDEFLAVLSQHLRQPMLGISLAANQLKDQGRRNGSDAMQRREIDTIARSAEEMLRVLGDLHERVALWGDAEPPPDMNGDRSRRDEVAGPRRSSPKKKPTMRKKAVPRSRKPAAKSK